MSDEPVPAHLLETVCVDCGIRCYAVVEWLDRARCEVHSIEHRGAMHPAEVIKGLRPRPRYVRQAPGLAGDVSRSRLESRLTLAAIDPWPATPPLSSRGIPEYPRALKTLVRAAQAAGCPIRVHYSRVMLPTRSIGVFKEVECFGVWAATWWAMYERTVGAASGWKWRIKDGISIKRLTEGLFRP